MQIVQQLKLKVDGTVGLLSDMIQVYLLCVRIVIEYFGAVNLQDSVISVGMQAMRGRCGCISSSWMYVKLWEV